MKHKRTLLILAGNLVALLILLQEVNAQDIRGYMYGRVTTLDNTYQGSIRWGKEETFWTDHFNASKMKDESLKAYREKESEKSSDWSDFNWAFKSIWEDKGGVVHQFSCEFGDIRSITNDGRSRIILELKNGEKKRLGGQGYNDIGTDIIVRDTELGDIAIKWDRMVKVEFLPTPKDLNLKSAPPIYGTVETFRKGTFTGLVQWDHDERLGDQRLDGDNRDGDISIPFREIQYIEKDGNGSRVILFSGRDFYLTNSNDVNADNRGIIVSMPGFGRVDIPWKYFKSLTLTQNPDSGPPYTAYKPPVGLRGKVYTVRDETHVGRILFDIDEAWEIEMLDGKDDGVAYMVPFKNIRAIVPKNYNYSMVELKNGEKLLLGDGRDVSDQNDGLLVYKRGGGEPVYIPWKDIVEISFD